MKNFRPYPEPEEYLDLEEMILTEEDEGLYQEIEDEIVKEKLEEVVAPLQPWDYLKRIEEFEEWSRKEMEENPIRIKEHVYFPYYTIPDCCKMCPNHPSNGGSGVCQCTLPYINQPTVSIPSVWTSDQITLDSVTTIAQSYWEEE